MPTQADLLGGLTMADPLNHTSTSVYDATGNVIATIDFLGFATTLAHDALNRPTRVQDPGGGITTTTVYDPVGNGVNVIDPDANKTTFAYDALDRQTQMIDPLGHAETLAYDAAGRLTSTGMKKRSRVNGTSMRVATAEK